MFKNILKNQAGIVFLVPLLIFAAVATTGTVAAVQVNKVRNTKKAETVKIAEQKAAEQAKDTVSDALAKAENVPAATPDVPAQAKPSTPPAQKPGESKPPATKPAPAEWKIVNPTASTCAQGTFTVYGSISDGTKIYNYYHREAIVVATLGYKQAKAVRCENSGFGPENSTSSEHWLEYGEVGVDGGEKYINIKDVSITSPPQ